jgi:hypothetical protein
MVAVVLSHLGQSCLQSFQFLLRNTVVVQQNYLGIEVRPKHCVEIVVVDAKQQRHCLSQREFQNCLGIFDVSNILDCLALLMFNRQWRTCIFCSGYCADPQLLDSLTYEVVGSLESRFVCCEIFHSKH